MAVSGKPEGLKQGTKIVSIIIGVSIIFLGIIFIYLLVTYQRITPFSKIVTFLIPLCIFGLIYTFRLKPSYRLNLALLIISITVVLYGLEAIQPRGLIFDDRIVQLKKWKALRLDTRSITRVYDDLKRGGVHLVQLSFVTKPVNGVFVKAMNTGLITLRDCIILAA